MTDDQHGSIAPGRVLGRYEVKRRLGSGGMGGVYEARHVDLDKAVAIKVLDKKLAKNRVYLERFVREGRLAAKLQHPHVVDVSDVGTHEGVPYLVMELLSGIDLDQHLDVVGRLDVGEALELLFPILAALIHVHGAGLVHRDLKPANIFLARAADGSFHPKLLDFGIAKPGDDEGGALTATTDVFGTPQYMAPEQVRRSRDATARADQYSMGAVLYRCVTGADALPLAGSSVFELLERVVSGSFERPSLLLPELVDSVEPVILRAMARRPEERFPSIKALGAALLPYADPATKRRWEATFAEPDALVNTLLPGELQRGVDDRADDRATSIAVDPLGKAAPDGEPSVAKSGRQGAPSLVVASRDLSVVTPRSRPWGVAAGVALTLIGLGTFAATRDGEDRSTHRIGDEVSPAAASIPTVTPAAPTSTHEPRETLAVTLGAADPASATPSASASAAPTQTPSAASVAARSTPRGPTSAGASSAPTTASPAPSVTLPPRPQPSPTYAIE